MVNNIITDKKRYEKWKSLPTALAKTISSIDTTEKVEEVGQKANLHIDQIGTLLDEVTLTLLGFTPREKFLENIISRLQINEKLAGQITKDLDEKIFAPIKGELQKNAEKMPEKVNQPRPKSTQGESIVPPIRNSKEIRFEQPRRGVDIKETTYQVPVPNYSKQNLPKDWDGVENRDLLMKEIENPQVASFKGEKPINKTKQPETTPQVSEKNPLLESAIIRTMQGDMVANKNKEPSHSTTADHNDNINTNINETNKINNQTTKPRLSTTPIPKPETPRARGKFGQGLAPVNLPMGNIVEPQKNSGPKPEVSQTPPLEKIKIPTIKKTYTVDPYREPTDTE